MNPKMAGRSTSPRPGSGGRQPHPPSLALRWTRRGGNAPSVLAMERAEVVYGVNGRMVREYFKLPVCGADIGSSPRAGSGGRQPRIARRGRGGAFSAIDAVGWLWGSVRFLKQTNFAGSERRKVANGSAAPLGRVIFFGRFPGVALPVVAYPGLISETPPALALLPGTG